MNFLKKAFFGASKENNKKEKSSQEGKIQQEEQIPLQILTQIFQKSAKYVSQSTKTISDENKLLIYGFYKQATVGDCNTAKPSMLDFVGKSKWTSWNNNKNMLKSDAMKSYISKAVEIDSQIQNKMQAFLQGSSYNSNKNQPVKQVTNSGMQSGAALKMATQKDYSDTYSHPYFRSIEKGLPLPKQQVKKQLLLQINNNPKCYPLHFAIDKERVDMVRDFLELLAVEEIESMKDEDGTGIEEYAQLIQNSEIIALVYMKLKPQQV